MTGVICGKNVTTKMKVLLYKTVVRLTFLLCCDNMANVNERRNGNVNNRGGDDVMGNLCEQCGISQT